MIWRRLLLLLSSLLLTSANYASSNYSELIQYALKNSSRIKEIRAQSLSQIEAAQLNGGTYPFRLFGTATYQDSENPQTSSFSQVASQVKTLEVGIEKPLAVGVTPYVSYKIGDNSSTSLFNGTQTLNAQYKDTNLKAGVRTDLLKSLILGKDRELYKEVLYNKAFLKLNNQLLEEEFLKQIIGQALQYYAVTNSFNHSTEKCKALHQFFKLSQKKWKSRLIEQREYLLISSQYKTCLIESESLQTSKNDSLLLLQALLEGSSTPLNVNKIKLQWPFSNKTIVKNPTQLKKMAQNRFDIKAATLAVKSSEAAYKKNRFETLPSLNLDASVGYTGADPSSTPEASSQSLSQDFPNYNIALTLSMPIGPSAQKSLKIKSKADFTLQKQKLAQLQSTILYELSSTTAQLNLLKKAITSHEAIKNIELKKWKIYQRDFKRGRIKFRELLENQNSYIAALENLSQAHYQYSLTYLNYMLQTGQSLSQL